MPHMMLNGDEQVQANSFDFLSESRDPSTPMRVSVGEALSMPQKAALINESKHCYHAKNSSNCNLQQQGRPQRMTLP